MMYAISFLTTHGFKSKIKVPQKDVGQLHYFVVGNVALIFSDQLLINSIISKKILLHVPNAIQINNVNQALTSIHSIGTTEKAQRIPKAKAITTLIVTVRSHANFLYAGFTALTMLVITVEHTTKIRITFVIVVYFMN